MSFLLTNMLLLCSVLLAGGASHAASEYPATYQSGRFIISTMDQFRVRNLELHPTLSITENPVENVEWQGQSYKGKEILAEGVESGNKITQAITYIELLPKLWKLIYVKNKVCIQGTILENGKDVTKWFCDDDPFPIKGFHDLFIVEDENVDLATLQSAFKDPLVPYVKVMEEAPKDQTMTLGDLRLALEKVGSVMTLESIQYVPELQPDKAPADAIKIHIEGQLNDKESIVQDFVYVIEGDNLLLRTINGKVCWFVESLQKDICEEIYEPSPVTNLPLKLINSDAVTGATNASQGDSMKPEEKISKDRQCGTLPSNFSTILKVHFQRSMFDVDSPAEYNRFLQNFPKVADPMGLLISEDEKKDLLQKFLVQANYDQKLQALVQEFGKGREGDCGFLLQFMEEIKNKTLPQSAQVFQLIGLIKSNDYQLEKVPQQGLSSYQLEVLQKLPGLVHPVLGPIDSEAALDVALQLIKGYMEKSLDRLSNLEKFALEAMSKQDNYSTMIPIEGEIAGAILGHQEKKYFGLSIETGISGRHYVTRLHPAAREQGLELGDELIQINGLVAQELPYLQVDKILLDTKNGIEMKLKRGEQQLSVSLVATNLDPLTFYYSVNVVQEGKAKLLNIQLSSFEPGIAESLYKKVQEVLKDQPVDGFILDLRNNPGGNTDEAVNLLSFFAKDRVVTLSKLGARDVSPIKVYEAKPEFFVDDEKPLLVMVNHNTMSSSEIVASGYQALGRSVTVGELTHGKLIGQFYIPTTLSDMSNYGLLITAFEFFTVEGKALNGIGVVPDVLMSDEILSADDGGVGLGKDIPAKDLPEVPLYQFSVKDLENLGISF